MSAIVGNDVWFAYAVGFLLKKTWALKGVTFEIPRGAVVGLLGHNGAGKTTLIQLITGIRGCARGDLNVIGHPAASAGAKRLIGFLPERPYFYPTLSGRRFLRHMYRLSGAGGADLKERVDRALNRVGLGHAGDRPLSGYSKGMLQRVGIAQSILHDPEILILDEPMSGLDPSGRVEIRNLIRELNREGKTIVFSSHVVSDVELLCDRVLMMAHGEILGEGTIDALLRGKPSETEILIRCGDREAKPGRGQKIRDRRRTSDGQVLVLDDDADVNEVLASLIAEGVPIAGVHTRRPSLEQLYGEGGR